MVITHRVRFEKPATQLVVETPEDLTADNRITILTEVTWRRTMAIPGS